MNVLNVGLPMNVSPRLLALLSFWNVFENIIYLMREVHLVAFMYDEQLGKNHSTNKGTISFVINSSHFSLKRTPPTWPVFTPCVQQRAVLYCLLTAVRGLCSRSSVTLKQGPINAPVPSQMEQRCGAGPLGIQIALLEPPGSEPPSVSYK